MPPNVFRENCGPFRVLTGRGTNKAVLSKMGDFLVEILVFENFFSSFYLIFTCLKLCKRILIKDCYATEMKGWCFCILAPPPNAFSLLLIVLLELNGNVIVHCSCSLKIPFTNKMMKAISPYIT